MRTIPEFIEFLKISAERETDPALQLYKSLDLAEAVLKYHTSIIVADYLKSLEGSLSDSKIEGTRILARGMVRPSLGLWALFTERIYPLVLEKNRFIENFGDYFEKELKENTQFLVFERNDYQHGFSRSAEAYLNSTEKILKNVIQILENSPIFECTFQTGDLLEGSSDTYEIVLVREDGRELNLSPLLILRKTENETRVYFFYELDTIINTKKITKLNYVKSEKYEDTEDAFIREFKKVFKLKEWSDGPPSKFQARISELIQNFQGRQEEERQVLDSFTLRESGAVLVLGVPGIGKSAFLAKVVTSIRSELSERVDLKAQGRIPNEQTFVVLEYFFRRNTGEVKLSEFYKFIGEELNLLFGTKDIPIGNNLQEKEAKWEERIRKISEKLSSGKGKNITKLILVLDGIDEAEEEITRLWRGETYPGVFFFLSSRPVPRADVVRARIPNAQEIDLQGLSLEDTRFFLLEINRKKILSDKEETILKTVFQKSGGEIFDKERSTERKKGANPLYLRLLADGINKGLYSFENLESLPLGLSSVYDPILKELKTKENSESLFLILYFITLAKDYVSRDTIAYFLKMDRFELDSLFSEILELLMKNPQKEKGEKFQFFHESLRDHFREKNKVELETIQRDYILPALEDWEKIHILQHDPNTDEYLMKYTITHLLEGVGIDLGDDRYDKESEENLAYRKKAEKLILNPDFHNSQVESLGQYSVSLDDAVMVLNRIIYELAGKPGTTRPLSEIFQPKREGEKFRTTIFVEIVNYTGDLSHKASTDIGIAWKWIEEGKVVQALERLSSIQDKQRLFDCYVLALWLLSLQPDGEENRAGLRLVLEEVEREIPKPETGVVKWHERYSVKFFANVCLELLQRDQVVEGIFSRGEDEHKKDVVLTWLGYSKNLYEGIKKNYVIKQVSLHVNKIIHLIDKIQEPSYKSSTLSALCYIISDNDDIHSRRNIFLESEKIARSVDNSEYRSRSLGFLGFTLYNVGELNRSKNLVLESIEISKSIPNLESRINSILNLSYLLNHFNLKELNIKLLLELISDIKKIEDSYRQAKYFTIAVKLLFLNNEENLAKELISEFINSVHKIDIPYNQSRAYSLICKTFFIVGEIESGKDLLFKSLKLLDRINESYHLYLALLCLGDSLFDLKEIENKVQFLNILIENCNRIESSYYKKNLLDLMIRLVINLNDKDLRRKYNQLLLIFAFEIKDIEFYSLSLSMLGESFSDLGDLELGKKLYFDSISGSKINIDISNKCTLLGNLSFSLFKVEEYILGDKLLIECLELLKYIDDFTFHSSLIFILINKILNTDRKDFYDKYFPIFIDYLNNIKDSFRFTEVLILLSNIISESCSQDVSRKFFPALMVLAQKPESIEDKSLSLFSMGIFLCKINNYESGIEVITESINLLKNVRRSLDKSRIIYRICSVISNLKNSDQFKNITYLLEEISHEIPNIQDSCNSLSGLAQTIYKMGDFERGKNLLLETFEKLTTIEDSYARSDALYNLIESLSNIRNIEIINQLYHTLINVLNTIEDEEDKCNVLNMIGELLLTLKDPNLITKPISDLIEISRNLNTLEYQSISLSNIAKINFLLGDKEKSQTLLSQSLNIIHTIQDSSIRTRTLIFLGKSISIYFNKKFISETVKHLLELGESMEVSMQRKKVLQSISKAIATFGSTYAYTFFESNHESHPESPEVVKAYTEEYRKINWEESKSVELLPYYIRSFLWIPRESEFSKEGAYDIISTMAKLGKIDEALEAFETIPITPPTKKDS